MRGAVAGEMDSGFASALLTRLAISFSIFRATSRFNTGRGCRAAPLHRGKNHAVLCALCFLCALCVKELSK